MEHKQVHFYILEMVKESSRISRRWT